jgi:hypothetical protein
MKKVFLLSVLFPIISLSQHKKDWFFGAEIGNNTINSFQLGDPNKSFQGGIIAEYYTGESWSLIGRIKYFKTGVSFYSQSTHTGGWFDLGSDGILVFSMVRLSQFLWILKENLILPQKLKVTSN